MTFALDSLPFFECQSYPGKYLSEGDSSVVYLISSKSIAKVSKPARKISLEEEYVKSRLVYDAGVTSPYPHGLFKVSLSDGTVVTGLVIRKIVGIRASCASKDDLKLAKSQLDIQLQKLDDLGFSTRDHNTSHNTLWVPKEKKLYLFDFEKLIEKSKEASQ